MRRLAAIAAILIALAGCTSVTTPASPSTPSRSTPEPTSSPTATPSPHTPARNPYEGGAERAWAVNLPGEPSALVFDRQSGTLVAAVADGHGTRLHAFAVSNSGRTLPAWSYTIPDAAPLARMDAASGSIYLSVGEDQPTDLIILGARSGTEELRWSRAHVLDTEVPFLVGAYDSGGGIARLGRDSVLAAMIDNKGRILSDQRIFMAGTSTDSITAGTDIINTRLPGAAGTTFIVYPEMSVVHGEACWSMVDGIVCISSGADGRSVLEYDRRGYRLRQTPLTEGSAGMVYDVQAINADTTSKEFASALTAKVNEHSEDAKGGQPSEGPSDEPRGRGAGSSNDGHEPAGEAAEPTDAAAEPSNGGDEPSSTTPTASPTTPERTPAILSDGRWVTEIPQGAEPLKRGAPYGIVNKTVTHLVTGKALADNLVLAGAGQSADMFFEWDGTKLHYLRPLG